MTDDVTQVDAMRHRCRSRAAAQLPAINNLELVLRVRKKLFSHKNSQPVRYNTIILSRQSQNYFYLFKNVAEKIFSQIRTRYFNNQRVTLFAFVESVGETRTKKSLELEFSQNIFVQ